MIMYKTHIWHYKVEKNWFIKIIGDSGLVVNLNNQMFTIKCDNVI